MGIYQFVTPPRDSIIVIDGEGKRKTAPVDPQAKIPTGPLTQGHSKIWNCP